MHPRPPLLGTKSGTLLEPPPPDVEPPEYEGVYDCRGAEYDCCVWLWAAAASAAAWAAASCSAASCSAFALASASAFSFCPFQCVFTSSQCAFPFIGIINLAD